MARLRLFGVAIGFASLLGATAGPASAGGDRHPLFNDQGTLAWYTSLDEAQAVARATGKLIFIESGRRACGNCRHVVEQVLPASNVRSRISAIAIGLADDCDESDPRVSAMLSAGCPDATVLPLCGFVTPELRWVAGFSGYMDPGSFSGYLTLGEERFERIKQFRPKPSVRPVPPCPAPAPVPAPTPAPDSDPRPAPIPAPRPAPAPMPAPRPAPAPAPAPIPPPAPFAVLPPKPAVPALPGSGNELPLPKPHSEPSAPPLAKVKPPTPTPPLAPTPTPPAAPIAPAKPQVVAALGLPMPRARAAAGEGRWGDVLKVNDESPRLSSAERSELDSLVRRANDWVLGSFEAVLASAKDRRYPDAKRTLTVLTTQLDGTTCPGLIDAERGVRAVDRLSAIEQGAPDQVDAPEQLRKASYAEFRGTRWASLFRSRPSGR